ncbi:MAG: hypothetical protein NC319_02070 [Butyricicoccus sp.]|nr:hypothetical protein [Butyricicoccus sp.]
MTAENIRQLCKVKLEHNIFELIRGAEDVTLKVQFKALNPETVMDELGFDDEAKTLVRAIYETLSESGALYIYYEAYHIPSNFTDAGRVLGLFEIRNVIETVLLAVSVMYLCIALLPLSLMPKIIVTMAACEKHHRRRGHYKG